MQTRYTYQEIDNVHMYNTKKILGGWEGKKNALTLLEECDQYLFQRVGPQRRSGQPWPVLVTFCPLPFSYLT